MNPFSPTSTPQKPTFHPSSVRDSCGVIDVGSIFNRPLLESVCHNSNQEFRGWNMVNFLFMRRLKRPLITNKLHLGCRSDSIAWRFITEFNRGVRFEHGDVKVGFGGSIKVSSVDNIGIVGDNCGGVGDGDLTLHNAGRGRFKKVLILMSDTGGGHRASAEAIKSAFTEEFGDEYQVSITDLWADHTPWPFNQLPKSYNFLVKHEALWKMTYYGSSPRVVHCANFAASSLIISEKVAKGLMQFQPDIIISVHPLMQHVPLQILRSKGLLKKIVFTTVVTDLCTCHPTWFHNLVSRCYCPTEILAKRALKAGLKESQIKVYGLPVRRSFVKPVLPKCELRKKLGMDEVLPAVLLMGGGEGMGPIEVTAQALEKSLYDGASGEARGQILVICGRNKKLMNKLSSVKWRIPVQVKAFVSKMEECMGACDCIITKAGPGTISEAMIYGLPIILNDFIAGQESGNVGYVVENGCGKFSRSPEEIARIVADWFGPNCNEMEKMSHNSLNMARPEAVVHLVHDLHNLLHQTRTLLVPHYA